MITSLAIQVGVVAAIGALLAALIELADRFIANYGECRITINDEEERSLNVQGGGHLLGALAENKLFIPSACGGRGSCGLCKVKVLEGGGPLLPTEAPYLSATERKNNVRLSCQVKVRNNLRIEIPQELFAIKRYAGRAGKIIDQTHDMKQLDIELTEPETLDFKAGQYVQLTAPEYAKSDQPIYRAYSICSDPTDESTISLLIRRVPDGICTTWVFDYLKVGDQVELNGPHGEFCLQPTAREILFIAGGSGLAPIRSMLFQMRNEKIDRKATFYFGAQTSDDLCYLEQMAQFERDLPQFKFVPALSMPRDEDRWEGAQGLITDVLDAGEHEFAQAEAYLCGSPGMIDACIKVLLTHGMPQERIFYDKFA
ncbi:MAG: 2Fe-2S iron-sulfur cluster binding domain-containing protein [Candidatus Alcyoniella australis]|nr:2Fe-2S iron-sulfur cluster binding domain-containing protein [Candidatus Alcyoniella australis]